MRFYKEVNHFLLNKGIRAKSNPKTYEVIEKSMPESQIYSKKQANDWQKNGF